MQTGSGENIQTFSERDVLEELLGSSKFTSKPKIILLWQWLNLIDGGNNRESHLIALPVTDLKLLARGLDITETDKLIRNAIACKSLDDRVRQRCLEKSKNLTLNTAIDIGRMFEATKDGMQVMAGEDPRVELNVLADKKGQPDRRRKPKQQNRGDSSRKSQKCTRCGYNSHRSLGQRLSLEKKS